MKKTTVKFGAIAIITFFVFFAYFYKNSGKFRSSILSSFIAITVIFSIPRPVRSGQAEVDAFTQQNQRHRNSPQKQGIFSRSQKKGPEKPNGDDPNGDDDNNDVPKYPKTESVEDTRQYLSDIDNKIRELEEMSESDSETEDDQCQLKEKAGFKELPNGKTFLYGMNNGTGLKKEAKKVWRNPKAKKEVLRMLERFDQEDRKLQEKSLKGFKSLTELKNSPSGVRIIVCRENGEPPKVVCFCMRKDLEATLAKLENKYN